MKQTCTFVFTLMMISLGFSQGTETFSNIPTINAYSDGTWTGDDGSTWKATKSRSDQTINGKAITMNDDTANTYVESGTIGGGLGEITITTQRKYSGGSGYLDVLINGNSVGTVPFGTNVETTTISDINISGDIVIRIDNNIGGSSNGGAERVAVDDITWTGFSASGPANPDAFTASTISESQIDLAYNDNAAGDTIVIVFDTDNTFNTPTGAAASVGNTFAGGTVLFNNTSNGTYNHTGLSASTTYYYKAFSYDGTEYSTGLTASASTPCGAISSFPFTEGFEGGVLPNCWSQEYVSGTVDWTYQDGDTNALSAHTGSYNAMLYDTTGKQTKLITPALDLSSITNATLTFWHAQQEWSPDQDELRVYYKTSADGSWTLIPGQQYTNSIASWTQETITLPSPSADYYIAFDGLGDYGRGVVIDDIEVDGAIATTDTTVQFVSATSTISEGIGTYDLEFSIINEDAATTSFEVALTGGDGDASDINGYTTQTVTFTGDSTTNQTVTLTITDDTDLETNETLTFSIQNVTGGNNAVAGANDTFVLTITNNDLPPSKPLPYNEDFSNCGTAEWTPYDEAGNDEWICSGGEYAINGYSSTADTDWLISDFNIDFDLYSSVIIDVTTRERYGDTNNTSGEFELLYSNDYTGGDPTAATWVALTFDPNNTSTGSSLSTASTTSVDASSISGKAYLAFKYDMTYGSGAEDWRIQQIDIYNDITNDSDTEVLDPNTQIAADTLIAADITTSNTAVNAFAFTIYDLGSGDGLPTQVSTMRFVPGANNTADWTDHIQGITLVDENSTLYSPTVSITDTEIILTFDTPIVVADDSLLEFTLGFYLNTTNIINDSVIQFQIDSATNGFVADTTGSEFAETFTAAVIGNDITIDVDLFQLLFIEQPTDTELSMVMSPSVTVAVVDENGNIDTDFTGSGYEISLTTNGSFDATASTTVEAINGIATFDNLVFDTVNTAITLTATDVVGFIEDAVSSNTFDITEPFCGGNESFTNLTISTSYSNGSFEGDNGVTWNYTRCRNDNSNYQINGTGIMLRNLSDGSKISSSSVSGGISSFTCKLLKGFSGSGDRQAELFINGESKGTSVIWDNTDLQTFTVNNINVSGDIVIEIRNIATKQFVIDDIEWSCYAEPISYVYDNGWTPINPNGVAAAGDDIIIASGNATIDTNTTVNSVTVNAGAGLTIDTGVTLTTTNGMALESTSTTYSSLILDGTLTGTLTYNRHVNINGSGTTGSNDLISAPLTGQVFSDFADTNPNILSNGAGTLFLFGHFDKGLGDYVTYSDTESITLDPGVGYRAASDNNDTFTFTGTANNGTITNDITNVGPTETEWNLVGNPYPSYLNVQNFLNHDVGDGVTNLELFESGTAAIYGYDGTALNGWTVYNLANTTPSTVIAPGQGFFVSADATNTPLYDLEFTPAMRSTGTGDDFISGRNAELIYVKLNASATNKSYNTEFYFNANATEGFDVGYDAAVWGNTTPEFALYSHLIENNAGDAIALQTLNSANLDDASIPLGVKANQGEQLTFSIADMNVPAATKVYLEDVVANTTTLLNNADYVITPTSDLNGTGRFFLRTANDALSTINNSLDNLNIFTLKASDELVVSGELLEHTKLSLYDIQGRLVLSTQLDDTMLENRIDLASINSGVYIVSIQNNGQEKTKKVIID